MKFISYLFCFPPNHLNPTKEITIKLSKKEKKRKLKWEFHLFLLSLLPFFRLILCSFRFFHCFLGSMSRENYCPLSLDTFPGVCTFPRDRWSLLLNFKHAATGSSGENWEPDGLTASFYEHASRLSADPVASELFFLYPRVSPELRSFLLFVACLDLMRKFVVDGHWNMLRLMNKFFDFCLVLFLWEFLHF